MTAVPPSSWPPRPQLNLSFLWKGVSKSAGGWVLDVLGGAKGLIRGHAQWVFSRGHHLQQHRQLVAEASDDQSHAWACRRQKKQQLGEQPVSWTFRLDLCTVRNKVSKQTTQNETHQLVPHLFQRHPSCTKAQPSSCKVGVESDGGPKPASIVL